MVGKEVDDLHSFAVVDRATALVVDEAVHRNDDVRCCCFEVE